MSSLAWEKLCGRLQIIWHNLRGVIDGQADQSFCIIFAKKTIPKIDPLHRVAGIASGACSNYTDGHLSAQSLTSIVDLHLHHASYRLAYPFDSSMALSKAFGRLPPLRSSAIRLLQTESRQLPPSDKHYVRIAGPSSYANRADVALFLSQNLTTLPESPILQQGQSDIYQNHSIWIYDAGSQAEAEKTASQISGKSLGLKLIRAAPVDQRIVDHLTDPPTKGSFQKASLRKKLNIIAPQGDERGRTLLVSNLPHLLQPRMLWGFFASYEVSAVRHLRRSGVACVIFRTQGEAERALRERANFALSGGHVVNLKMHD